MIDISTCLPISGWMGEHELTWLAHMAEQHAQIIEVGSWCGRSTRALCLHTKGFVYAVDPWKQMDDPESGLVVSQAQADEALTIFRENLGEFAEHLHVLRGTGPEAAKSLFGVYGRSFDFVFIDGDHSQKAFRADLEAYLPLVVQGGIISGHDNWMPGVKSTIEELVPGYKCPAGGIWMKQL